MASDVTLEVLHVRDCPNVAPMLERLAEVTDRPIVTRRIDTAEDAVERRMAGSPTLLVNGADAFAGGESCACGVSCRIYRDEDGRMVPVPSVAQLRDAIASGGQSVVVLERVEASEALSAWRTRAVPLEPVEAAMHQAILRGFAAAGVPPAVDDLEAVAASHARTTADVLRALHEIDAIRLGPDGRIAVAYPFSATPTRHRVRIGDWIEVYAMCAIDALGIASMLGVDTLIQSVDAASGEPITVTMSSGRATWTPDSAVAVIGADAGGGPSADCCCDHLNFFTDANAARKWLAAYPEVPGQVLSQAQAEELGDRLFGHLLADG